MAERRTRTWWPVAVLAVTVGPLLLLPLRSVADVWRAPALWPQELGLRGFEWVASPGARITEAVTTSLVVAVLSTVIALAVSWPAARSLAGAPTRRRTVLLALIALPVLVPQFATGVGLTTWLLRLGLADTIAGLVAAHLVYVVPYSVLVLAPAFDDELLRLEEAAATTGAGTWARLRYVTLPATARSTALAALLGFVVSWSQYGTSLAVGGGELTLPLVLLPFVGRDPQITAALSLVFLLPPVVALTVAGRRWRIAT